MAPAIQETGVGTIKWPNDLLVEGGKSVVSWPGELNYWVGHLVVGIGINANQTWDFLRMYGTYLSERR